MARPGAPSGATVVGLTGNMAAGKSVVADLWRQAGVPVVSADDLARRAVAPGTPGLERVRALLGPEAIAPDGAMDRAAVRRMVFGDESLRRALEALVHPEVRRLRDAWTRKRQRAGADVVVWEVPLLFETGGEREVDVVVVVDAPAGERRRRAMGDRGLGAEEANAMMAAQGEPQAKRDRADFVIDNRGSREALAARAADVLGRIRRRHARSALVDAVVAELTGASPVVVTTHVNADGDAAGSAIALTAFLQAHGAEARIAMATSLSRTFAPLLPDPGWVLPRKSAAERDWCRRAGLVVVADTADERRIGRIAALVRGLPAVVIDHHPPPGRHAATAPHAIEGLALIDTDAAAAAELVFEVIDRAGGPWTPTIVDALYTGVLTDTGGFRFRNTTARSFGIAARLVELGANPEALHRAAYSGHHLRRYALLRESLATLTLHPGGRVAWMIVPEDAYAALEATGADLTGFVDVPRDLAGVEVAILFRTTRDGGIKVSLRSIEPAAVDAIARELGGGGHRRAAAAVVSGPVERAVERVVAMVAASLQG